MDTEVPSAASNNLDSKARDPWWTEKRLSGCAPWHQEEMAQSLGVPVRRGGPHTENPGPGGRPLNQGPCLPTCRAQAIVRVSPTSSKAQAHSQHLAVK